MIKIPNDLQSVLSASYHVNSFKGAVEELIYNSLDASSTSIAVRVHIQENSIQVIDNGRGIKRYDFNLLGQRYTTSKFDNLTRLKSIPLTYGYRGLSLSSVIEISREVKIASRFQDSKETFTKIFRKGRCKEIAETTSRPSKGTTVEIYGLLYNLKIQRKSLDHCSELFAIKTLLERLSLLHLNVSFSLRDDEKNEIIFKVHKNRDIFQTLSSLFDIHSNALQEIMVEKNQYKVKGFIGKRYIELKKIHWVFLNGKYVSKTILHKIINKKFMEILHIRKNKPRNKTKLTEEMSNQDLPTYFLFLSCPYSDYDINPDAGKIAIEFKSWDQITNLVEKLIQCYSGEFKFKEITKPNYVNDKQINDIKEINTRAEVKRIMDKILAKNSMKHRPSSQMCNGIKGKNINRKHKKTDRLKGLSNKIKHNILPSKHQSNSSKTQKSLFNSHQFKNQTTDEKAKPEKKSRRLKIDSKKEIKSRTKTTNDGLKSKLLHKADADESINFHDSESKVQKIMIKNPFEKKRKVSMNTVVDLKTNKPDAFEASLQHDEAIKIRSRRYFKEKYANNQVCRIDSKNVITSYDLVQTILNCSTIINNLGIQFTHDKNFQENSPVINYTEFKNHDEILSTKLTYQSHNYSINENKNMFEKRSRTNMHFISKASRDNFLPKNKQYKKIDYRHGVIKNKNWRSKKQDVFNSVKLGIEQSLYSIQLSNSSFNKKLHTHNSTNLYPKSINESLDAYSNIFNTLIQKNIDTENIGKTLDYEYIISETNKSHFQVNSNQKTYNITYSINSSKKYTKTSQTKDNTEKEDILLNENNDFTPKNTKDMKTIDHIILDDVVDLEVKDISPEILDPLTLCETIYNARNVLDEYNNSNYQLLPNNDNLLYDDNSENLMSLSRSSVKQKTESNDKHILTHHLNTEEINEIFLHTFYSNINNHKENFSNSHNSFEIGLTKLDGFNIQSRFTFVPKGMSPIFTNCNPKSGGKRNLHDEYYKDELYKNFAQQVVDTAQIFEPKIQNINDTPRNHISKANNKMKKDNADLMFDAKSIKNAKVLGQVDCKFIVTLLSGKTVTNNTSSNFLVLFDQHAVHERIRLEKNLLDYFNGILWKSVKIDPIDFKLCEDDVVLLHNHKEKLSRFGLQWNILDKNISIYAIPEAIIGKCPRQFDIVLSATKCLLSELIDALKSLKGNIPVYPQSIMNLVFSEACRYAIMFGDKLSKSDCINLIESLAECKTPFQCAHGRPVMAVIMEMIEEQPRYKINFAKVKQFKDARNMEFTKK